MNNLLKANFYKLLKDKTTYIMCGVAVLSALVVIVLFKLIGNVSAEGGTGVTITGTITAQALFLSGVSLSQNIGVVIAIAVSLYIGKEFSQNTIRNKIIIGYSKTKVYLSNLIMSAVISMGMYLVYQLVVISIGLPLLGWGSQFVLGEFVRQLVNSILIIVTFAAAINMVGMLTRSLVAGLLTTIIGVIILAMLFSGLNGIAFTGFAKDLMNIIMKSNFVGQSMILATENSISFMLWVIASSIITIAGTTVLGCYAFEKVDVK